MPIKHAIWTVGGKPAPLALGKEGACGSISRCLHQTANNWRGNAWSSGSTRGLTSEQQLEEMIVADPRILASEWMLIGRQEITPFGGRLDLLAIAPDGSRFPSADIYLGHPPEPAGLAHVCTEEKACRKTR